MKISIIVATYNDKEHLKLTLDSILSQDYESYECIVIDGSSGDGTIEILKEYEKLFQLRKHDFVWKSEADKGIYDAINKGIMLAQGDLIGVLYDLYADNHVLSKIVSVIKDEKTDGVHGDLVYRSKEKIVRYWKMGQGKIVKGWIAGHPTLYLKKEIYQKYGLYNIDYKCSGDYEFQTRIFKDNIVKLSYIPEVLVYMFYGGTSSNGLHAYMVSLKEGNQALKENGYKFNWWITFRRMIKVLLQFLYGYRKRKNGKYSN